MADTKKGPISTDKNENESFRDNVNYVTIRGEEFEAAVRSGDIPNYHVIKVHDLETTNEDIEKAKTKDSAKMKKRA